MCAFTFPGNLSEHGIANNYLFTIHREKKNSYQDAVEEKRCKIFKANIDYIDSFNTVGNKLNRLCVSGFAD